MRRCYGAQHEHELPSPEAMLFCSVHLSDESSLSVAAAECVQIADIRALQVLGAPAALAPELYRIFF